MSKFTNGKYTRDEYDFSKLKIRKITKEQVQTLGLNFDSRGIAKSNFNTMSHKSLFEIVSGGDSQRKRDLSKWFMAKNGMYNRAVRYISDVLKFDYLVYLNFDLDYEVKEGEQKTIMKKYDDVLDHFEESSIQLMCRQWAQKVCSEGVYYGYICDDISDKLVVQDLPADYCRSRFRYRGIPLVEFNVKYFDKITSDQEKRIKILNLFPDEIQKYYRQLHNSGLPAEEQGDEAGWVLLNADRAFKFNFSEGDLPPFLAAIPSLIQLEEVQDLQKEKLLQEIQKILVQTFELDKNGQIPFSMNELQTLNQNALDMVGDTVGVSVLSTIADVHLEEVGTSDANESQRSVDNQKNDAYNNFGISTNLFNTDGNLSLEKSITIDEAFAKPLLLQFEQFFNRYLSWKFNKKGLKFRLKMLTTSIFNYKDLSDKYKDLTKLGFSRFLPMVALGHSQKEIISLAKLEQQFLQLDAYMLPPFSSNTMSSDTWTQIKGIQQEVLAGKTNVGAGSNANKSSQIQEAIQQTESLGGAAKAAAQVLNDEKTGRPELPEDKKSDKTLANNASK